MYVSFFIILIQTVDRNRTRFTLYRNACTDTENMINTLHLEAPPALLTVSKQVPKHSSSEIFHRFRAYLTPGRHIVQLTIKI